MPAKLFVRPNTHLSQDFLDTFDKNEVDTHRKLLKRVRELTGNLNDRAKLNASLDKVCMLTTVSDGALSDTVIPLQNKSSVYTAVMLCLDRLVKRGTSGGTTIYSRIKLETETVPQTGPRDLPQVPEYCSVLFIPSERSQSDRGRIHLDFHWLLMQDKTLAVILAPSTSSTIECPVVHSYIDANGLMQKFRTCNNCGKSSASIRLCPRCTKIGYCNKACQTADWISHKATCVGSRQSEADHAESPKSESCSQAKSNASSTEADTGAKSIDLSGIIEAISPQICVVCGASDSLKACKCKTLYCGLACRDADWPSHKKICKSKLKAQSQTGTCSKCKKPTDGTICPKCALT
jgi:hypothetical protein